MRMCDYLATTQRVTDTNVQHGMMKDVSYATGYTTGGGSPPLGGWVHGLPVRLAKYQLNYTGMLTWQSWSELNWRGEHDTELPTNNAQNAALLLMQRNLASPSTGLPIPLSDYALRTAQVYYG